MPDAPANPDNLKTLWQDQPSAPPPQPAPELLRSRARTLAASTRTEILTSLAAALFFAAILPWRVGLTPMVTASLVLVVVWSAGTLIWFRTRIWGSPDKLHADVAASGLAFYRAELRERHRHLRNSWLWHGPLLLSGLTFVAVATQSMVWSLRRVLSLLPLVAVLLIWTGFSIRRRRLQAEEIRRELDQMEHL